MVKSWHAYHSDRCKSCAFIYVPKLQYSIDLNRKDRAKRYHKSSIFNLQFRLVRLSMYSIHDILSGLPVRRVWILLFQRPCFFEENCRLYPRQSGRLLWWGNRTHRSWWPEMQSRSRCIRPPASDCFDSNRSAAFGPEGRHDKPGPPCELHAGPQDYTRR